MITIAQALATATTRLTNATVSPRLDAEVLLAWAVGLTRTELLSYADASIDTNVEDFFGQVITRRQQGIPVAYITGRQAFMDFEVDVTPHTLIPRPFTETLVTALLTDLGNAQRLVADIGTGSGAIALAIARLAPTSRVIGTDISVPALQVAAANARRLNLLRQIDWRAGSLLAPLRVEDRVDTVIANLPYLPDAALKEPTIQYEPRIALSGGPDGLVFMTRLVAELKDRSMITTVFFELLPTQIDHLGHDLRQAGFTIEPISDGRVHRGLIARR